MVRRLLVPTIAALLAAAVTTGVAIGGTSSTKGHGRPTRPTRSGSGATCPTATLQATVGVPNLIADMNSQQLAFTVHDGDLKAGSSSPCTDARLHAGARLPERAAGAGGLHAGRQRLDRLRPRRQRRLQLARAARPRAAGVLRTPFTLGQHRLRQQVQTTPLCLGVSGPYRASRTAAGRVGGVTYATLNVQGSCNNLCDIAPDPAEYAARNARQHRLAAGDLRGGARPPLGRGHAHLPGRSRLGPDRRAPARRSATRRRSRETDGQPDGFQEFLTALRDEVVAFRRPVAYVHGDSHYFRIDKPFLDAAGRRLENFTRVETFGDNQENGNNDVNWLKVHVDPRSREVFAYQPQIVPGNRTRFRRRARARRPLRPPGATA